MSLRILGISGSLDFSGVNRRYRRYCYQDREIRGWPGHLINETKKGNRVLCIESLVKTQSREIKHRSGRKEKKRNCRLFTLK